MIPIKTSEEIEIMRQAGKYLAQIMREIARQVKPGISTFELDELAEKLIRQIGAESAFKGYLPDTVQPNHRSGYPATLCTSINNEVVHGIPNKNRFLKNGDIVGIDCGLKLKGYFSDMAITLAVGKVGPAAKKLLNVTKKALDLAIKKIKPGIHLGDVSFTIQNYVEKNNFSVVRELSGHGVGQKLHEEPTILNFGKPSTGPILKEGMVLAIEPMVNTGTWQIKTLPDGWTIVTADGSLSAHFEHTIVVTKNGAKILTK
ncbi:MAG: type I methionyl aminopeptidase [Patescibacteria group bacterium]